MKKKTEFNIVREWKEWIFGVKRFLHMRTQKKIRPTMCGAIVLAVTSLVSACVSGVLLKLVTTDPQEVERIKQAEIPEKLEWLAQALNPAEFMIFAEHIVAQDSMYTGALLTGQPYIIYFAVMVIATFCLLSLAVVFVLNI